MFEKNALYQLNSRLNLEFLDESHSECSKINFSDEKNRRKSLFSHNTQAERRSSELKFLDL